MNAVQNNKLTVVIVANSRMFVVSGEQTPSAELRPGEYQLVPGETLNIPRMGQLLRVISGCAWITFDGEDMILSAGQEMVLQPGEDVAVISALAGEPLVYRVYKTLK